MKRKIISVFTAIMVFLVTIVGSIPELGFPVSAADVPKKVLILGDSISTGYGLADASAESFGALIDTANNIDLTNLAVNGDTSLGFLNKLNNNTMQTAVQNSDIILVSIGLNDPAYDRTSYDNAS